MIDFRSKTWLADWLRKNMPTREQMERNRFIRPFASRVLRSELWRFTRRSVPRGVALGMLVGVIVPFAQIFFAALLRVDAATVVAPVNTAIQQTDLQQFLQWLTGSLILPLSLGLVVIAVIAASFSYLISGWIWRWWTARKWKRRRHWRSRHQGAAT